MFSEYFNEKGHFAYPSLSLDFEWKWFYWSSIHEPNYASEKYITHLMNLFQMAPASSRMNEMVTDYNSIQ